MARQAHHTLLSELGVSQISHAAMSASGHGDMLREASCAPRLAPRARCAWHTRMSRDALCCALRRWPRSALQSCPISPARPRVPDKSAHLPIEVDARPLVRSCDGQSARGWVVLLAGSRPAQMASTFSGRCSHSKQTSGAMAKCGCPYSRMASPNANASARVAC